MTESKAAREVGREQGDLGMRAAVRDITPSTPGPLAGYEARRGAPSTGTQDALEAALLVIGDSHSQVAWLTIDVIAVPAPLAALLRDAVRAGLNEHGLPVVVAASHTHSAPLDWVGSIYPGHSGESDPLVVAELIDHVRSLAAGVAAQPEEPVTGGWAERHAVGVGANRLDPQGPHDDRVGVLTLRSVPGGALRAVLFDAATHPTVYGPDNLRWSADWPGAARRVLRAAAAAMNAAAEHSGPAPIVLFLQGATGDVSARFTRRGNDAVEVARLGGIAAAAGIAAIAHDARPLSACVRHTNRVVDFERRVLPSWEAAEREVDEALAVREALVGLSPIDPKVRLAQSRVDGALVQRALVAADPARVLACEVSVIAIGDVAWVHVPVELFSRIGERIRAGSPFPTTRVIGYADGYLGYLPDESAFIQGTYEALSSLFPADAADRLVHETCEILKEIR
ncbi:hypothetical protein [Microbacterium sp.]|uniref:hypothetical protein n=1 Tax=Microbacterium sp. TaxID=51671 RepID=UPI003F96454A